MHGHRFILLPGQQSKVEVDVTIINTFLGRLVSIWLESC